MKKMLSMILASLLAVSMLSGCGSSAASSASSEAPSSTAASSEASSQVSSSEAAATSDSDKPLAGKELKVALSANFKYFESVTVDAQGNEKYEGLDIDILDYMAEDLGFTYTISNMPFSSLIGSLQAGQADFVISGMSYTEERAESVDFSDAYATAKVGCLVRSDSGITDVAGLSGQAVACSAGTNYEKIIQSIEGAELKTFDGQAACTQEMLAGRVNATITGATACKKVCEENEGLSYFIIDPSQLDVGSLSTYNIAFPKGSELVPIFNEEIAKMKENGKLDEIISTWLGEDYIKEG